MHLIQQTHVDTKEILCLLKGQITLPKQVALPRNFPWRIVAISEQDKDLLNNDIIQKLAAQRQGLQTIHG